jgi:hypothetical protein
MPVAIRFALQPVERQRERRVPFNKIRRLREQILQFGSGLVVAPEPKQRHRNLICDLKRTRSQLARAAEPLQGFFQLVILLCQQPVLEVRLEIVRVAGEFGFELLACAFALVGASG